jgi:hypothetical protein
MGVILLNEDLSPEPYFIGDQGDLCRGQRPGKEESERWVTFFLTEGLPYLRSLILRTRVTSGEARGQAKQNERDGCHSF